MYVASRVYLCYFVYFCMSVQVYICLRVNMYGIVCVCVCVPDVYTDLVSYMWVCASGSIQLYLCLPEPVFAHL